MKKILILLAITILFAGCVTTTQDSIEKDQNNPTPVDSDQIVTAFELKYYDLVQFDENGDYDKGATDEALDKLFTNHPLIKDLRYMTPEGEVAEKNPYYDSGSKDMLVSLDENGNVAPVTSRRIDFMMFRYRTITYIGVEVKTANGTSGMSSGSSFSFENPEDIVAGALSREMNSFNPYDIINFDSLNIGAITVVNDPGISKYAFTYYIPESASKDKLLKVAFIGHGSPGSDYIELVDNRAGMNTQQWIELAEEYGYAFFTVWTPQRAQYMSRNTMIPGEIENDFWARPDLEYMKVIDAFMNKLEIDGFNAHRKVYMTGFSNGGAQSNVFPVMHPEYVEATAPGASGQYLIPYKEMGGYEFTWPNGFADAGKIEGWDFNAEEFKTVEYFTFVGGEDLDAGLSGDLDSMSLLPDRAPTYREVFGTEGYERVEPFTNYLKEFGVNATYKIYEGYGHEFPMIMKQDVFQFFDSIPVE